MMDFSIVKDILDRYIAGTANPVEQKHVENWLQENGSVDNEWNNMDAETQSEWIDNLHNDLVKHITGQPLRKEAKVIGFPWYRRLYVQLAAAVIIIVAAWGIYFVYSVTLPATPIVTQELIFQNDAAPGSNKAVLTLADGATILLDGSKDGLVTKQGGTEVIKKGDQLVYNARQKNIAVSYNTLTTPRGGQYKLVLPDGSKLWLNAASSIRYPVSFLQNLREVEVKGEAYFEIAPAFNSGKKIPFRVIIAEAKNAGGQKAVVEVLGTHFNINAYDDEGAIKTTLLEGSVKVSLPGSVAGNKSILLAAHQQAQLSKNGLLQLVKDVNVEETVAWKNGLFMMSGTAIPAVLRQLARWYDVDIVYGNSMPEGRITGDIPRDMNLSEVLKVMELSGVHFKIDNKKIIVNP